MTITEPVSLAAPAVVPITRPWDHGRLKVDKTCRNLVHEDGHPFFWMGDSCWELIHRSTREEVDEYLTDRAAKRFNVIQPVAVAEFGAFNVPSRYGHLAFEKTKAFPNGDMGMPRVGPGDNDDYWDHVDYVIDKAAEKGIYVCLVVTWASYITMPYACDESNAYAFGSFIGKRYANRPNVIYMLGCDRDSVYNGVDYRPVWRLMAKGIKDHDPNHLMSFLTKYHDARHWFGGESWLDFNMIQYRAPVNNWDVHNLVSLAVDKQPPMPAINVECQLEGVVEGPAPVDAAMCRREFYWYTFSGAFGHTYGHLALITWWDNSRPYWTWFKGPTIGWREALDSDGAREKLFSRNLFESRPQLGRVTDPSIIAAGQTEFVNHLEACRGAGYAMIYTPTGRAFAVNMGRISGDEVKAWWFDPRTGDATLIGTFPNRGSRTFKAPGEAKLGNDWVLVLDDASRRYPAPGSEDFPQSAHLHAEPPIKAYPPALTGKPAAANLLSNGSFDEGERDWILNGAELAQDSGATDASGNRTALRMTAGNFKSAEQRIAASPKTRYTFAGHVRLDSRDGAFSLSVIFIDDHGKEINRRLIEPELKGTLPYERHAIDFTTPPDTKYIDVRLASHDSAAGAVYFDQISITPAR